MPTRHKMGTKPVREPTEEDKKWAADLFTERMRFVRYNEEYIVQMHTTDAEAVDRLITLYGGGSYLVPGTNTIRWRASKHLMLDLLDKIQPFLTPLAGQRLLALADLLDAQAKANKRRGLHREISFFARELAKQQALAENMKGVGGVE